MRRDLIRFAATALVMSAALAGCSDPDDPLHSGAPLATVGAGQLITAIQAGDAPAVRAALGAGASPDTVDGGGTPVLVLATHADDIEVARLLIEAGADVNAKDRIQDSAYLYAAAEGRLAILRLTLAHGADLTSTNRFGGTGLIPAAHHGHVETVRELLKTSIDIDHINNLGWTALLEAVILGDGGASHTEIVRLLVEAGADMAVADRGGVTPLAHARERGYSAIVAILEAAGARN
ncbi:MAG: ankyrin repeat domain-containing protein [Dehalococcoidia bacterium]